MMQYQQGDVLFVVSDVDLSSMKPVQATGGRLILAEGEATGHAHAIVADPEVELFEDDGGVLYLRCSSEKTVTHEEHGPTTVLPGTYEIGIVIEQDPFADEVRRVAD